MKTNHLTLFLLCFTLPLSAQFSLKGKVLNTAQEAIEYANILVLHSKDTSLVKGAVSSSDGFYEIKDLKAGSYLVNISYLGFETYQEEISLIKNLDLGTTTLKGNSQDLEEVVVKANKPLYELSLDKMVINVQSSITSAGGNALEVLERSPGVIVDRVQGRLELVGRQGVQVMINGKLSRQPLSGIIAMLAGMSADNIEKIELINNPSAKYEAGGNGGIINIVLVKRSDLGTNGNSSLSLGYGREDKEGLSLNLNHRKKAINWFANISYNRDHSYQVFTNDRTVNETGSSFISRTVSNRDPISNNINGRLGLDYDLSDKTTLGVLVTGYRNEWDMDALNSGFESLDGQRTLFEVQSGERNRWVNFLSNFNVHHQLKKGQISFDIDYLFFEQDNPTDYLNTFSNALGEVQDQESIRATKITPINIVVSRLDYVNDLSEKIKFSAGVKGISSSLNNLVNVEDLINGNFVKNENLSENADLKEQIAAVYSTLDFKWSEKTQFNIGLRYEHTLTHLSTNEDDKLLDLNYGNLFPSVFVKHQFDDQWSTQLSYGRRINRPAYNDLAPFVIFIDPNTFFFGNTALQAAFSQNYKADIMFKQFLFSLNYNNEDEAIASYQPTLLPGSNQQVFTSLNLEYKRTYSVLFSFPVPIKDWWNLRLNLMAVSRDVLTKADERLSQENWSFNGNMNLQLPANFSFELSGFYESSGIGGIARLSSFGNMSLGIQKRFNNDSNLRLSLNNIFDFEYDVFTAMNLNLDYSTNTNYRFESRIFRLTYSTSFGNEKLKAARRRSTGSEDIKRRVN